jgi:hypothetical protein
MRTISLTDQTYVALVHLARRHDSTPETYVARHIEQHADSDYGDGVLVGVFEVLELYGITTHDERERALNRVLRGLGPINPPEPATKATAEARGVTE